MTITAEASSVASAARALLSVCDAMFVAHSQPVRWYRLILAMEEFRLRTGMGLAHSWGLVHRGDYEGARSSFEKLITDWDGYCHRRGLDPLGDGLGGETS